MINRYEVYETNQMIAEENLDVRTITLGISLLDCIDADLDKLNENIYNRITTVAKDLAAVGEKDTSKAHRAKIAAANGITNYAYTAAQNTKMVNLLKKGKLIKA